MPDELEEEAPPVEVEVNVDTDPEEELEEVASAETGDQTVIVETPEEGASEAEVERAVETAVAISQLQDTVLGLVSAVEELRARQTVTEVVAEEAHEEASDAFAEAEAASEDAEDATEEEREDEPPSSAHTHPLFRSRAEWKNRNN